MSLRFFILVTLVLLSGCQTKSPPANMVVSMPAMDQNLLPFQEPLPSLDSWFDLSTEQQQHFLSFFHNPDFAHHSPAQRLSLYLHNKLVTFHYLGENLSASEALRENKGNCLTLAVVTTALARLVNIDLGYQLMSSQPVINVKNGVWLSSDHVRTLLYKPAEPGAPLLERGAIVVDYFPDAQDISGPTLPETRFHAMIFNNLAADAFIARQNPKAYALAIAALQQDPGYVPAVNLLALALKRAGALDQAQSWFHYGTHLADPNLSLLANYRDFMKTRGDLQAALHIEQQIESAHFGNPFADLVLALEAYHHRNYQKAQRYYQRVLRQAPHLQKAYLALLDLYLQEGQYQQARQVAETAIQYAYEPGLQSFYQAKLAALSQQPE